MLPIKSQDDPITDDEVLLRRVHINRLPRFPLSEEVEYAAFVPRSRKSRSPDDGGISLHRLACQSHPTDVLRMVVDPIKLLENGVVAVTVTEVRALGLEVRRADDRNEKEDLRVFGHVVIPQINCDDYYAPGRDAFLDNAIEGLRKCVNVPGRLLVKPSPPANTIRHAAS